MEPKYLTKKAHTHNALRKPNHLLIIHRRLAEKSEGSNPMNIQCKYVCIIMVRPIVIYGTIIYTYRMNLNTSQIKGRYYNLLLKLGLLKGNFR